MRKTSVKKANELYRAMIIRYCYPYCICLDTERYAVAFINRDYCYVRDYPAFKEEYWYILDQFRFNNLRNYLEKAIKDFIGKYL